MDTVYYWKGGRAIGRWIETMSPRPLPDQIAELNRAGYVAYAGRRSIGAPTDPPSDLELREVTRFRPN
jgi:hypothetical protein